MWFLEDLLYKFFIFFCFVDLVEDEISPSLEAGTDLISNSVSQLVQMVRVWIVGLRGTLVSAFMRRNTTRRAVAANPLLRTTAISFSFLFATFTHYRSCQCNN